MPTPRGGGLAIVALWFGALILLHFNNKIPNNLFFALFSGLLLAVISFLDDIFSLRPVFRLIAQIGSSSLALFFLKGFDTTYFFDAKIFDILIIPFIITGMIWYINLYNFLDGIDGYASLEAIFVAFSMYIFTGELLTLVLIAPVAGFLFWNWPKAKIFMGDVGSTQLGFILIVLGVYFHNSDGLDFLVWIILTSSFWFDATLTLLRRWKNGEKLSHAHKKHAYQRIVQYGFSHQRVLFILIFVNAIIFLITIVYREFDFLKIPLILITLAGLYFLYKMVDKRVPFDSL
ncbi:MAG: glycosyltransferase family 4 protein [Clostridiaceae bacterium]|nr:glycosyltransferase family 4 protein [Clostridiaceae bacterium]